MMDDLNQLEKQQQPKIIADRDRNHTAWGASVVGAVALGLSIFLNSPLWLFIILLIVSILSYTFMVILCFQKDQYE